MARAINCAEQSGDPVTRVMPNIDRGRFYELKVAAAEVGMHSETLRRAIERRELKASRPTWKHYILGADLTEWMQSRA